MYQSTNINIISQLRVLEYLAHFPILSAIDTAAQPHSGRCRFPPSLCRHNATISCKILLLSWDQSCKRTGVAISPVNWVRLKGLVSKYLSICILPTKTLLQGYNIEWVTEMVKKIYFVCFHYPPVPSNPSQWRYTSYFTIFLVSTESYRPDLPVQSFPGDIHDVVGNRMRFGNKGHHLRDICVIKFKLRSCWSK